MVFDIGDRHLQEFAAIIKVSHAVIMNVSCRKNLKPVIAKDMNKMGLCEAIDVPTAIFSFMLRDVSVAAETRRCLK